MDKPGFLSLSRLRWVLVALLVCSVVAAIPTSSAYIALGSEGMAQWLSIYAHIGPYYLLWAVVIPGIHRLSMSHLNPARGMLRAAAGHTALCILLSIGWALVIHQSNWQLWLLGRNAPGYYAMSAFSYSLILLGIYLYELQRKVTEQGRVIGRQRARRLELESNLNRTQLEMLRGQMNPHFLFNALNGIGALIETGKSEQAYAALEDLGGLLRAALEHRYDELIPLQDELDFVRRYLSMEQVRSGDRLDVKFDTDAALGRWLVPPFVLQPLIENVIKHVVSVNLGDTLVRVTSRRTEEGLMLRVEDDGGSNCKSSERGTGVGLENLRARLALIYGEDGRLEFKQNSERTRVELCIPDENALVHKETGSIGKNPGAPPPV